MIYWTVFCLAVALVTGVLGLTGMAAASQGFVWGLFVVSLLLFVISVVASRRKRRRQP